ncbi:alpha galactosidase A [Actinocrispum wychmicini]|uniref:Alpha galactosidase A n=1 Tax=Actinocrispum wychmicini TaxID=1213861 RepID=A0A4R2JHT2_9PSEU|nr:alpha galactosidase A [Actinocrispum wychmicini]
MGLDTEIAADVQLDGARAQQLSLARVMLDAGTQTCGGYPGSGPNHFATDARDFASWAVDYLKLDGCNVQSQPGMSMEAVYRLPGRPELAVRHRLVGSSRATLA